MKNKLIIKKNSIEIVMNGERQHDLERRVCRVDMVSEPGHIPVVAFHYVMDEVFVEDCEIIKK